MTHLVWPFMPQHGVDEVLEWKTDVLRTKAGEQRMALRKTPRQIFSYKHFLTEHQASLARAMAYGWGHGQFGVPVWVEMSFVGSVSSGATSVLVDTTVADYRVGGLVLLWESEEKFVEATVSSLTSTQVNFTATVGSSFASAYICPLRVGKSLNGLAIQRGPNTLAKGDIEFRVEDNADLGASAGFPTLSGIDILTDTVYYLGSHEERIIREVDVMDNETGIVYAPPRYDRTDQTFTLAFNTQGRASLARIRKWLHLRKGKLKPFWLISQSNDLTLLTNMLSTDTSISVRSIKYGLYCSTSAIEILRNNGTATYHLITSGSTVGNIDTLFFSTTAGIAANVSDIKSISFMRKVCFDSDRIEISHQENASATIKIPAREVLA